MSLITCIVGWIETDGYQYEKNNAVLDGLKYDDDFIQMFCKPKNTGNKNPGYILFGASINYCDLEAWVNKFEVFIKKLGAFGAFVFIEYHDGDETFVLGYTLSRGEETGYQKRKLEFGESYNYASHLSFDFPVLFRILYHLSGESTNNGN